MSERPENPPAFPNHPDLRIDGEADEWLGMTLRDWFAGQALVGFLADSGQRLIAEAFAEDGLFANESENTKTAVVNSELAIGCYQLADAMLAARKEPQQ